MSKPRTQEERRAIVEKCLEIEKKGGDVIGYLESEHYISAKSTWHNMQKYDLKRSENQITSGRPKHPDFRIGKRRNLLEMSQKCLEEIAAGRSPIDMLQVEGYANARQAWTDIRAWMKANQPAMFDSIPPEWMDMRKRDRPAPESKVGIPKKPKQEPKPTPVPKAGEPVNKYRFIPLKELKRRLQAELARAAQTDVNRACEITDDLKAIERVAQLGSEALKERPA